MKEDMKIKISAIIPVYNVEKYLERCIQSILNQNIRELEIILINDGSTDSSPDICDKYAQLDSRITVIHKQNGRVAAARNDGLKIAKGKYISFIDSDDWIELNMYEEMYNKAEKFACDIVMCDYTKQGIKELYTVSQPISEGLYDKNRVEKELFKCLIMFENIEFPPTISNCTCLFRREFLIENKLYYDEDIHYCEDSIFGSKALYNANNFYYMRGNYFYNYFYNPESTTSKYNYKKWDSYIEINKKLEKYFKESNFDFERQIKINMLYFVLNTLAEINRSEETFNKKRKMCREIMHNERVVSLFKSFKIPNVGYKFKFVIKLIKYRCSWLYSRLFYR